jgi:hypothetical protein
VAAVTAETDAPGPTPAEVARSRLVTARAVDVPEARRGRARTNVEDGAPG